MSKKTISTVMGAAIATSLAGIANAGENPFAIKDLTHGYMQVAEAGKEAKEMACGEGKCGAQALKNPEMNCGAMKDAAAKKEAEQKKAMEGKCAGMKMDAPAAPAAPAAPKAP
ncbi:HvfA family oxazolone/thioamide-modified RiPP metallophore [Methylomagnum sp.]